MRNVKQNLKKQKEEKSGIKETKKKKEWRSNCAR